MDLVVVSVSSNHLSHQSDYIFGETIFLFIFDIIIMTGKLAFILNLRQL